MNRLHPACVALLTLGLFSVACSSDPSTLSSDSNPIAPSLAAEGPATVRSVVVATIEVDIGPDGTVDRVGATTTRYDARGNVVSMDQWGENSDGDNQVAYSSTREYNVHADLIAAVDKETSDGYVSTTTLSTAALNRQGHPVLQSLEYEGGASTQLVNQFDARGRIVGQTFGSDETRVYDFDAHDNIVHWTVVVTPVGRVEESIEYSAHDAVLSSAQIHTQGAQQVSQTLETNEVDTQGYPTVQTLEVYSRGRLSERDITSIRYDGHHRPLIQVEDLDTYRNGNPDIRVTTRFEYRGADVPVAHGLSALASRQEDPRANQRLRGLSGSDQRRGGEIDLPTRSH